jgi:hypothetical protein
MRLFVSLALLLAAATASAETVLSTGLMLGSTEGAHIECSLVNLGTKPVTVVPQAIDPILVDEPVVPPGENFCTEPVAPGKICAFTHTDADARALGGVFRIAHGNAKLLRGNCSLFIGGILEVRQLMQ